jgi:hypothetical protein
MLKSIVLSRDTARTSGWSSTAGPRMSQKGAVLDLIYVRGRFASSSSFRPSSASMSENGLVWTLSMVKGSFRSPLVELRPAALNQTAAAGRALSRTVLPTGQE